MFIVRELSGYKQGTFREHSGNIQCAFREHATAHSGNIQGPFRKHSGTIQRPTFRLVIIGMVID